MNDVVKATELTQQALTIAKEIKDTQLESAASQLWKLAEATRLSQQGNEQAPGDLRASLKSLEQELRQAMLTTMKERPNPIDWAAFTLIGESK